MSKTYELATDILMEIDIFKEMGMRPTLIILNPVDYLMIKEIGGGIINNEVKRSFFGIEIIRSGDLEVGTFYIK